MTEQELIDAILTNTDRPHIDEYQIDAACLQRLKYVCGNYGRDGDNARRLLDMAWDLLEGEQ
jgi:hypothetical protein